MQDELMVGLDVGSTTVKAVVVRRENDEMIWQDYQRHETKQPEKSLEFLRRIEAEFLHLNLHTLAYRADLRIHTWNFTNLEHELNYLFA